jgi:ubiquinone/menaquinone biosynthesis C-methylase UbiE
VTLGQRFARLVTDLVTRFPVLWRVFRGPLRRNFDRLAPTWDSLRVTERYLSPMQTALAAVEPPPARILDVGTGTGGGARLSAARWPGAEIVGVDLSAAMIAEARTRATSEHERYEVADASALPFPGGSFDLVTLVNMIPFYDELARVTAPQGAVAIAFTRGAGTPIYVPFERVDAELRRRGFSEISHFEAGDGISLLARLSPISAR